MSAHSNNFSSVPILDYALISNEAGRETFITQLRHALINVGFLYLKNHSVSQDVVDRLIKYIPKLFDIPQESKDKIKMANSEHFLGYSRLGTELTKGQVDQREQFDFGTKHKCRWQKGDPDYFRIWGPSQWPDEELIPGFRETFEEYLERVEGLSLQFSSLVAEALGLGPKGLAHFYDTKDLMQHRGKIVKYPAVTGGNEQGVGPHYDAGFLTFLLQASPHEGLQVQNPSGEWIDVPPIPGTFVINIGKALEFVTQKLARATSHRVLSPKGDTPRYSVPFFQNISLNIRLAHEVLNFPPDILKLRNERGTVAATECTPFLCGILKSESLEVDDTLPAVNFSEFDREPSGRVNLIGRVKSHPETGEIHYPELFREIFPNGYSGKGSAY